VNTSTYQTITELRKSQVQIVKEEVLLIFKFKRLLGTNSEQNILLGTAGGWGISATRCSENSLALEVEQKNASQGEDRYKNNIGRLKWMHWKVQKDHNNESAKTYAFVARWLVGSCLTASSFSSSSLLRLDPGTDFEGSLSSMTRDWCIPDCGDVS